MKSTAQLITLLLLLAGIAFQVQAQDEQDDVKKRKPHYGTHNDFKIDLGMNNFLEDGKSPADNNALYAVKPWGSWYVALKSINDTHIGGPLHIEWGADVSWYNFKFQNEGVRINEAPNQVVFTEVAGDLAPVKSKLTAAYINASLVPMLKFGESGHHRHHHHWHGWKGWDDDGGFRIGVGGYAGYKIASYAKYVTKIEGDREKNKDKDGFYLNNFRYGVRLQMGFRGMDVFVNYDMNELFAENKGPQLNAFSFGVVL